MIAVQALVEAALGVFATVVAYRCFSGPLNRGRHAASVGLIMAVVAAATFVTAAGTTFGWSAPLSALGWTLRSVVVPVLLIARSARYLLGSEFLEQHLTRPLTGVGVAAAAAGFLAVGEVQVDAISGQVIPRPWVGTPAATVSTWFALAAWLTFIAALGVIAWRVQGLPEYEAPKLRVERTIVSLLLALALFALAVLLDERGADDLARAASLASDLLIVVVLGVSTLLGLRWELQRQTGDRDPA